MDFRTSAKVVRLNVNDDGYCVELHTSSDVWLKQFLDFARNLDEKNNKHLEALKDNDSVDERIKHILEFDGEIKEEFAKLFGDGAYEATFGSELVGVEYIVEFIEACLPFVQKRVDDRSKAFDKYDPKKTGGAG